VNEVNEGLEEEILSAVDIEPGEHRVRIDDITGGSRLYFKGYKKPFVMDPTTFRALAKDFGQGNAALWGGREVILSASGADVAVRARVNTSSPAIASQPILANELASALMRAMAPPHSRADAIAILREAANILAAH
jgi:hypothetical protein